MLRKLLSVDEIRAPMTDNETWNNCPVCGFTWKDKIPTPGLIHRTQHCNRCSNDSKKPRSVTVYQRPYIQPI